MDEAVERAITEYGRAFDRSIFEAKAKFEVESEEGRKRIVEEAVSALR